MLVILLLIQALFIICVCKIDVKKKKLSIMDVAVMKCSCESKFQDETYGKGNRLFNLRDQKKHPGEASCTVCGTKTSNANKR